MAVLQARPDGLVELTSFEIASREFCIDSRSVLEIGEWITTTRTSHTPDALDPPPIDCDVRERCVDAIIPLECRVLSHLVVSALRTGAHRIAA